MGALRGTSAEDAAYQVQLTALSEVKVESALQVAQRWILARLRDQRFFSLAEMNRAIRSLLEQLSDRPMQKLG